MGLFGWVMCGLGYEDKNPKEKKKNKGEQQDKYAEFNLHERVDEGTNSASENVSSGINMSGFSMQTESNIIMVEPKTHKQMQSVIDYLKQGQSVAVNLEGIALEDNARILDFFSGAIYALNGSITRWKDDLFLLAPEGHKILKPSDKE